MPMKGFGNKDTTIAMSKFRAQILASKCHQKDPGLLGEQADSRTEAGKVSDDPGAYFRPGSEVLKESWDVSTGNDLSITINYSNKL